MEELGQGKARFKYIDNDHNGKIETWEVRRAMTRGY